MSAAVELGLQAKMSCQASGHGLQVLAATRKVKSVTNNRSCNCVKVQIQVPPLSKNSAHVAGKGRTLCSDQTGCESDKKISQH